MTLQTFDSLPKPMLAGVAKEPFDSLDYIYEPKLDGCRMYLLYEDGKIRFFSRSLKEHTASLPDLQVIQKSLRRVKSCLLDGELIAYVDGKMSFAAAQGAFSRTHSDEIQERIDTMRIEYSAFDILAANGRDVTTASSTGAYPLKNRKKALARIVEPSDKIKLIPFTRGDGIAKFAEFIDLGYEGMMAKRLDSLYQPGARNDSWLKVKPVEEDTYFIIGWTTGTGRRAELFGGLLLGRLDDEADTIRYCGIAGTGLTDNDLVTLLAKMKERETYSLPIDGKLPNRVAGFCAPMAADIQFQERTPTGKLRFPSFMRLRPDIENEEVTWTTTKR